MIFFYHIRRTWQGTCRPEPCRTSTGLLVPVFKALLVLFPQPPCSLLSSIAGITEDSSVTFLGSARTHRTHHTPFLHTHEYVGAHLRSVLG